MPPHSDPDELALRALGEKVGDDGHLASCPACQSELDQLRAVVATARAVQPEDVPVAPPPRVWDAVAAELGIDAAHDDLAARRARPSLAGRFGLLALAAAVVVGIALGAVGTAVLSGDGATGSPGAVVARADLEPLPERAGSGVAEVLGSGDRRELAVEVTGLTGDADGFYEVWLLDKDAQRLVSLGVLRGDRGQFPLPATVDVAEYPVVDVSIEPVDGNPAHSGDSVVRGLLAG